MNGLFPDTSLTSRVGFWLLICFSVSSSFAQEKKPTRTATETTLGEITLEQIDFKKRNFWISPDSRHYAFIEAGAVLIVDGKKQEFGGTANNGKGNIFSFSPDSQHFTYVGRDKEGKDWVYLDGKPLGVGHNFVAAPPIFSPDSKHIAYTCRRYVGGGTKYFLVIDDKDRETYDEGTTWNITWSGDSQRVALGVEKENKYLMREVSIDATVPTIEHKHGPANLQLNPIRGNQGQLGYLAKDDQGQFLFFDGKEWGKGFKEIKRGNIVFSDNGKEVAIMGEISSFRDSVWHQGKMSEVSSDMEDDTIAISADGARVGYVVEKFGKARAVIDGQEGKEYKEVAGITFSSDSKKVAYRALSGDKFVLVVNGVEGPGYDGMGFPYFSRDGKSIACAASQGESEFVLMDGQPSMNGVPQKAYTKVTAPYFSPKGKHLLYLGETSGKKTLIDNGKPLESHDGAVDQFFFSDDESLLAYIATVGEEEIVLINGVPGNKYETIMTMGGGGVIFDGVQKMHYIAIKAGKLLLVEEKLGE